MKIITGILAIYFILFQDHTHCYYSSFDMTEQKLCLDKGSFTFTELELNDEIVIRGYYSFVRDTLILNEGFIGGKHIFENEIKLVRKNKKLYHLYEGKLSKLYFREK